MQRRRSLIGFKIKHGGVRKQIHVFGWKHVLRKIRDVALHPIKGCYRLLTSYLNEISAVDVKTEAVWGHIEVW